MRHCKLFIIALGVAALALPVMLALAASAPAPRSALSAGSAQAASECTSCHAEVMDVSSGKHAAVTCETCHEGSAAHTAAPNDPGSYPRVHFDMEVCKACHLDQYNTFRTDVPGKTYYGGSDPGLDAPKGWSKTADFPWWNVLIDGHPFVQETYEDRAMMWNQIDAQETIRPKSEACLECHGTKVAFKMGITYRDATGNIVTLPGQQQTLRDSHKISTGSTINPGGPGTPWLPIVVTLDVPSGTKVSSFTDAVNPPLYQVKTVVTLPDGRTYKSYGYPDPTATATGDDPDANKRTEARNWLFAALEAMAFDELQYTQGADPAKPFEGSGYNWPSIEAGELCNQCHDPHSGRLRIVRKALIEAIARRGINPTSPAKSQIKDFDQANRQDQIIAVCAQCHSEYVGGYSAVDRLDRDYFPWGKPEDVELSYSQLFGYNQDWRHGAPAAPWQCANANARGFYPYCTRYPIDETLTKIQHPEAETFWNSKMYNAGVTCTDCHTAGSMRRRGMQQTASHWFTSPVKLINQGNNPCSRCHMMESASQSLQKIKNIQDQFYFAQERTQAALVNALASINARKAQGQDVSQAVSLYKQAQLRWEYYAQAENSMGFHNKDEALAAMNQSRDLASRITDWPLPPIEIKVVATGKVTATLSWYDQATNELGFVIERQTVASPAGPYVQVARIPSPNTNANPNIGYLTWTDTGLIPGMAYNYRVAAYHTSGTSTFSLPAQAALLDVPTQPPAAPSNLTVVNRMCSSLELRWTDNSKDESGFYIERSSDGGTTWTRIGTLAANTTTYKDTGLSRRTTYWYRVQAFSAAGVSAYSNVASSTTRQS